VKGSLLRGNGSFGGRSKITHTLTSDLIPAQSPCLIVARRVSEQIGNYDKSLGKWWLGSSTIAHGESVYRAVIALGSIEKIQNVALSKFLDVARRMLGQDGAILSR
jgi:hypothetical protein